MKLYNPFKKINQLNQTIATLNNSILDLKTDIANLESKVADTMFTEDEVENIVENIVENRVEAKIEDEMYDVTDRIDTLESDFITYDDVDERVQDAIENEVGEMVRNNFTSLIDDYNLATYGDIEATCVTVDNINEVVSSAIESMGLAKKDDIADIAKWSKAIEILSKALMDINDLTK